MATRALSADARPASLENALTFPPVSRRGFAGFAAIGLAAVAVPVAVARSADPRRPWDVLVERYEAALRADETFSRDVYNPGWDRLERKIGREPARVFKSVTREGSVVEYRVDRGEDQLPWGSPFDPARDMAREFTAWRQRGLQMEREPWWMAIDERADQLGDDLYRAEEAVLLAPAPDGAALARKVSIMFERRDGQFSHGVTAAMRADATRLM